MIAAPIIQKYKNAFQGDWQHLLPAVVVKSACQYIAMVALTKSGLDRLVHITWEVRKVEEQKYF